MPSVALALGGGGARGLAHIGVLARLERAGFHVDALAGTSIGGLMAAVYAAGNTPAEMEDWARRALEGGLLSLRPSVGGLIGTDRIRHLLEEILGQTTFAQARCPVAITAVDLEAGDELVIRDGRLIDAVLATIALPGIFPPQLSGGVRLVDGGVIDPVPVRPARQLSSSPIVAVALSMAPGSPSVYSLSAPAEKNPFGWLTRLRLGQALLVFGRSLEISSRLFTDLRLRLDDPEVIVRPAVGHIGILDSPNPAPVIEAGWIAMEHSLGDLLSYYGLGGGLRRWARRARRRIVPPAL